MAAPAYVASRDTGGRFLSQARTASPRSVYVASQQTGGQFVPANVSGRPIFTKLFISLDQPNKFKAGDTVSGSVNLVSEQVGGEDLDVGSISITFSGRSTTTRPLRETPSHRRTLNLFEFKDQLFVGPQKLHVPGNPARGVALPGFPFSFIFPFNCGFAQNEDFEGAPFFNSDRNQPIPGSFTAESTVDKGSIVYELVAELRGPDFKGYHTRAGTLQRLPLTVYSQRAVQEPIVKFDSRSKSFVHRSLELVPPAERESLKSPTTLRQKLGLQSISTDRYPRAEFTATVLMPSAAIINQPLPLMLHVDHDRDKSTVIPPPIVHLKRVGVWLRTETSICGMMHRSPAFNQNVGRQQTGWTTGVQIAGMVFEKQLPRVEHLDLRRVMNLHLSPTLTPTFKTFNFARTYSLSVHVLVKCAGKDFAIWTGKHARCTLLSEDYEAGLPEYTVPPPSEQVADEAPPPYEMVAQTRELVITHPQIAPPRRGHRGHSGMVGNAAVAAGASASASAGAAGASIAASSAGGGGGGGGGG